MSKIKNIKPDPDRLPVDNRCGWWELLQPPDVATAFSGECRVDVAIIGGGYTGLAIARRVAERDPRRSIALPL